MNSASSNTLAKSSFWIGVFLVLATHVYMLALGLPASQMMAHAILNLFAGFLIVLGWIKR